jgi:hypothetical protein
MPKHNTDNKGKLLVIFFVPPWRDFVASPLNFCYCYQDRIVPPDKPGPPLLASLARGWRDRASLQGRRPPVHKFSRPPIKVDIEVDRIGEARDCLRTSADIVGYVRRSRRSLEGVASKVSDQTSSGHLLFYSKSSYLLALFGLFIKQKTRSNLLRV